MIPGMTRGLAIAAVVLCAAPAGADLAALARARERYNAGDYEAAIAAAQAARADPEATDPATIVLARAYLERFRRTAANQDLNTARAALQSLEPSRLTPRDRLDHGVGVAETLYLEGAFGAAAELFESLLAVSASLDPATRERVVDWWASALDAEARARPAERRAPFYRRIVAAMEAEWRQEAGARVASYWLAAAARGLGDPDRAWQAAVAGWVRTSFAAGGFGTARHDLDRLVREAIIPDRVGQLELPAAEAAAAEARLGAEWDEVKERWTIPNPEPPTPNP